MKRALILATVLLAPLVMFQNCGSGFKGGSASSPQDVSKIDELYGVVGPLPPLEDPPPPIDPVPADEASIPSNCTHGTNEYGPYPSGAEPDRHVDHCQSFSDLNKIVFVKNGVEQQVAILECNGVVKHQRSCRNKLAVYNPNNPPDLSEGQYVVQDRAYRLIDTQ